MPYVVNTSTNRIPSLTEGLYQPIPRTYRVYQLIPLPPPGPRAGTREAAAATLAAATSVVPMVLRQPCSRLNRRSCCGRGVAGVIASRHATPDDSLCASIEKMT